MPKVGALDSDVVFYPNVVGYHSLNRDRPGVLWPKLNSRNPLRRLALVSGSQVKGRAFGVKTRRRQFEAVEAWLKDEDCVAAYCIRPQIALPFDNVFSPDFAVRLRGLDVVIFLCVGLDHAKSNTSYNAIKTWCKAVNSWGYLGEWRVVVLTSFSQLKRSVRSVLGVDAKPTIGKPKQPQPAAVDRAAPPEWDLNATDMSGGPAISSQSRPVRTRGRRGAKVDAGVDGPTRYRVWYGTTRKPKDPKDRSKGFASMRDPNGAMHLGFCEVDIPKSRRFGTFQPGWFKRLLGAPSTKVATCVELSRSHFLAHLQSGIRTSAEKSVLVFIHGYNVSFRDAAIRTAQLAADLRVGHAVFFSWGSANRLTWYPHDTAAIQAAVPKLCTFLRGIIQSHGANHVHIIAHSMGNRGALPALSRLGRQILQFGQLIFAAPDVDAQVFIDETRALKRSAFRNTLYVSGRDSPVRLSRHLYQYPRAGYIPPVTTATYFDTVVATNVDVSILGHAYFAESTAVLYDIAQLIHHNSPPEKRTRIRAENAHWVIAK